MRSAVSRFSGIDSRYIPPMTNPTTSTIGTATTTPSDAEPCMSPNTTAIAPMIVDSAITIVRSTPDCNVSSTAAVDTP
jgi:hypothetical protein